MFARGAFLLLAVRVGIADAVAARDRVPLAVATIRARRKVLCRSHLELVAATRAFVGPPSSRRCRLAPDRPLRASSRRYQRRRPDRTDPNATAAITPRAHDLPAWNNLDR